VKILLSTLNATYQHCAFGLRYLYANLGDLQKDARLAEFTIAQNPRDIAEKILEEKPLIAGFGVYIWNVRQTEEVVSLLKRVAPEILIVLGGPEVSHESEGQSICAKADIVLKGEADVLFAEVCRAYLAEGKRPATKFLQAELPDLKRLASPYVHYSDEDIRNRVLYVEASRGCPYKCEFCLSALDTSVRNFELERLLAELETLIARGARQFKFVDRTFNLSPHLSGRILDFFLERVGLGLFLHFEMVPDRLPRELRDRIRRFPPGSLQFEIGIQTWNPEVAALVSRRQDYDKVRENLAFLQTETGVHLHVDLIAGLPGEDLESFGRGFDAVAALGSQEIQVGVLKRLKGAPIARHDGPWEMVYQDVAPFTVARTRVLSFESVQKIQRFAKFWDLYQNSGNFRASMALVREAAEREGSLFKKFWDFSEFLARRHPQGHGISLMNQAESMWRYLSGPLGIAAGRAARAITEDFCEGAVKRDLPPFLKAAHPQSGLPRSVSKRTSRQFKHGSLIGPSSLADKRGEAGSWDA
jgi:radical SAM superfamily enzyme YgiQ (UPF0313 family)